MALSFKPIRPLLQARTAGWSGVFSFVGLGIGVLLLLCCVQMYINLEQLTREGNVRRNGFDYIPIAKKLTPELMRGPDKNFFTDADLADLKQQTFTLAVSPLVANQFRVQLSAGQLIPFTTELFLESLDDDFIDTLPPSFSWSEGQETVPIIISADFFEIYSVFAQGQGLPQFSREAATSIRVFITCFGNGREVTFPGRIVAFSDRVNSILVPKTFMEKANQAFGPGGKTPSSRVFIKTRDANDPALLQYLDAKKYEINKEKTILGRNKMIIQHVLSGLGIVGLLVVLLALLLFSFYLQLIIARSSDNLQLLLTLGYSPAWLSQKVARRFVPIYVIVVLIAVLLTGILQWSFYHGVLLERPGVSPWLHYSIPAAGLLLIVLAAYTNYRTVRRLLARLYRT